MKKLLLTAALVAAMSNPKEIIVVFIIKYI